MKINLPYVYVIPDRKGNRRIYFWRGKGHPRVRLREEPHSAAFHQRYDDLMRGVRQTARMARPKKRTLSWLCSAYIVSPEFQRLERATQKERRLILESACREPVAPSASETFADFPLERFTAKAMRVLRDRKTNWLAEFVRSRPLH